MRILGINCMNHDAAMAVVDIDCGGDILWAAHAERYSKIKNDHTMMVFGEYVKMLFVSLHVVYTVQAHLKVL